VLIGWSGGSTVAVQHPEPEDESDWRMELMVLVFTRAVIDRITTKKSRMYERKKTCMSVLMPDERIAVVPRAPGPSPPWRPRWDGQRALVFLVLYEGNDRS
jgi:hypothetical protein